MRRLAMLIYSIAGPTLAGAGVIVVLSADHGTLWPIVIAAAIGAAAAVPVSVAVARRLVA
jgi:hypothetical protein